MDPLMKIAMATLAVALIMAMSMVSSVSGVSSVDSNTFRDLVSSQLSAKLKAKFY